LSNRHISFSDLRCTEISDADAFFIAQSDLCDRELLIIDEAEELSELPEMTKVLQGFEEGGIKLLYVVTVPMEKMTLAEDQFIIAAGNRSEEPVEVPQATKDRFIHVELKIEGPAPGQSMQNYLLQNAGFKVD
jgi:MoxR-like ATPase